MNLFESGFTNSIPRLTGSSSDCANETKGDNNVNRIQIAGFVVLEYNKGPLVTILDPPVAVRENVVGCGVCG